MSNNHNWSNPRQIVRPRSTGRVPVLLCVLLAGLCSLAVYRWGYEHWWPIRAKPTFTATAYVVDPEKDADDLYPEASTANRAASVPLVSTCADPQRAREAVEALAHQHIAEREKEWQSGIEQRLAATRRSTDEMRQIHQLAVAECEAFERQLHETAAEKPAAAADTPHRKTTINPQWLELDRQSAELIARRDQLLDTRTHLHPLVAETSERIAEVERRKAAIPRELPDFNESAAHDDPASAAEEPIALENRWKLDELAAAVAEAEEKLREAELAQQQIEQRMANEPQYSIEYDAVVKNLPGMDYGWRRLLWTSLAVGLMMAVGAGVFSYGAGMEPPVVTALEVRKLTGKSVVGTIPVDDVIADRTTINRQTSVQRKTIIIGVMLILICPVVAAWGVMGI